MTTISEIADEMKAAFIADPVLIDRYGLIAGKTFDEQFAESTIEASIINVMATSVATIIWQRESYEEDIRNMIKQTFIGTVDWYGALVKSWEYNGDNPIRHVSVLEQFPKLVFKVNTEGFGVIGAESEEMVALLAYVNENKVAGTHIEIVSREPDNILPTLTVVVDAQMFDHEGQLLLDGSFPVEDAIDAYLGGVEYDGILYKSKLVDAVQAVDGVLDVSLESLQVIQESGRTIIITGMNYISYGGGLISTDKTITYVLS